MECPKCKSEIKGNPKFCPNCGEKAIELTSDLMDLFKKVSGMWFLIGKEYGKLKTEKEIEKFEDNFKDSDFYEHFIEARNFAKTHKINNKLKEEVRLLESQKSH